MTVRIDLVPVAPAAVQPAIDAARGRPPLVPATGTLEATVARGAAQARCDVLARGSLVVTTGQQPGLLGGPLYGLYKGLAAAAFAARLERELGEPVVPVFWVAGDDHDFQEANQATILSTENELLALALRERPHDAAQLPLASEPVGPEITAVLTALSGATPETEFKAQVLAALARCYQPEASLADAYAAWMAELLAGAGVVVYRAHAASAKAVVGPLLVRALELGVHRLPDPGPVPTPPDATFVMVDAELGRDRLVEDDGAFHARRSGERWTLEEIEALSHEAPERLSPNVLLRPVAESYVWRSVAYLAGPGELAYLPQARPVYDALGVSWQPPVPRFGARLVEGRVQRVLAKLGIDPDALGGPPGSLENDLAREELPSETSQALARLRSAVETGYPDLATAVEAVDPTMRRPVESAMGSALSGLSDLEKRIIGHLKRRNETLVRQIEKARLSLFPSGRPQERVFGWPMFGIRYGQALLDDLARAAGEWANSLPLDPPAA